MNDYVFVFVTVSSREEGDTIARRLVDLGLSPCVNILPSCRSIYRWKGETRAEDESLMIIKSLRALFPKVKEAVESLHSYDVPEVVALPVVEASEKYRSYLDGFFNEAI